jgi:superfamily II DNA or RNA helicase
VAYFHDVENEEKRNEKIERLKESTKWIKFYDRRSDTFASGLVKIVCNYLKKKGVKYKVTDRRKPIPKFKLIEKFSFVDKVEHRPEQIEIVNQALQKGRGIIHGATNLGKTECAAAIISEFNRQTGRVPRVLFLIHRAGLAQQTIDRFRKHLGPIRISMLGAGKKHITRKSRIVVATVQTASRLVQDAEFRSFQENCDILFIDEFHLNKAWTCSQICKDNAASMRLGLSGTIDIKNKAKSLHYIGMCGPIISEVRNRELVELGRSAKPIIRFVECESQHIRKGHKFSEAYRLGIVHSQERNRLVTKEVIRYLGKDYKTLVTVSRIKHGIILKREIEKRIDLRVEFISGGTPLEVRKKVIRKFERGKIAVLIASPIFDVGMDVPAIQAWVNAAGGQGWELILQRLGRVLRKKKGENKVYVTDFIDKCNVYLMRHSMARLRHYVREKIADISIIESRN